MATAAMTKPAALSTLVDKVLCHAITATHPNSSIPKRGSQDDRVERDWTRVGVLFNSGASRQTPDVERLLLDTARACADNTRLLPLVVTWLSRYGQFVTRHRLKRLVQTELGPEHSATLGLIVEEAIRNPRTTHPDLTNLTGRRARRSGRR